MNKLQITVSGSAAQGKTTVATLLAGYLSSVGFTVTTEGINIIRGCNPNDRLEALKAKGLDIHIVEELTKK